VNVYISAQSFKTGILAVPTVTGGLGDSYGTDDHYWLLVNYVVMYYSLSLFTIDHVVMGFMLP
jgi:hypothetical protein